MCDKVFDRYFVFDSVPDQCKTQEMCNKISSEDPFQLRYCHDTHKTQEMCNKVDGDFLPALKFVPDWFVTSKKIKNLLTALYVDANILIFDEYSGDATFYCNQMGIVSADLNDTN